MKRAWILIVVVVLFLPRLAFAAVAYNHSDAITATGVSSITISNFVMSGGSNTLLICGGVIQNGSPGTFTWNSVAMTEWTTMFPSFETYVEAYYTAGASGTHDVTMTLVGSGQLALGCSDYTGVNQTTPLTGLTTSITPTWITMTPPTDGLSWDIAADMYASDCSNALAETSGLTSRIEFCSNFGTPGNEIVYMSGTRTTSGDHQWSAFWAQIGALINPAAGAATARRHRVLLQ